MLLAILQFIPDADDPYEIVAGLMEAVLRVRPAARRVRVVRRGPQGVTGGGG
jgi:hypothetical protein